MQSENLSSISPRLSQEYLRMVNEIVIADGSHYKLPDEYKTACANVHNFSKSDDSVFEKKTIEQKIEKLYVELINPKQKTKTPDFLGENKTELIEAASTKGKACNITHKKGGVLIQRTAKISKKCSVIKTQTSFAYGGREGILKDSTSNVL